MEMSPQIDQLAAAMAAAQGEIKGAVKDSTNPHFRSKFADLASVWDACRGPLSKHGIAVMQAPSSEGPHVSVETVVMHSSGQYLRTVLSMSASQDTPQAIGSAVTYARRYSLAAVVGVAPEDDDGEGAEHRPVGYDVSDQRVPEKPKPAAVSAPADTIVAVLKGVKAGRSGAKSELVLASGEALLCYDTRATALAEQCCQNGEAVEITINRSTSGNRYAKSLKRAPKKPAFTSIPPATENAAIDAEIAAHEAQAEMVL